MEPLFAPFCVRDAVLVAPVVTPPLCTLSLPPSSIVRGAEMHGSHVRLVGLDVAVLRTVSGAALAAAACATAVARAAAAAVTTVSVLVSDITDDAGTRFAADRLVCRRSECERGTCCAAGSYWATSGEPCIPTFTPPGVPRRKPPRSIDELPISCVGVPGESRPHGKVGGVDSGRDA